MKKKCMDKGSKERSPPHNLRQKPGQYICCQNHKLIADIENDIMDPVMQCTTLPSHSGFSQQKLVSFVTEIHTLSIDISFRDYDLYNNFKIVEQYVKKSVGASSGAQNLAFLTTSSTSSTNDVNIANHAYEVSTVIPNINTACPQDLEQIYEDDLEAMDLKWQLSLLKQVSEDTSSFVESPPNVDKESVFLVDKKIEFVKPKNHEKPVKKSVRQKQLNTARPKAVKTVRPNSTVVNAVRGKPQQDDTGFIDSGCSRHMTGNIA
ncbi:hypothetical protein Tco_1539965 [Tanacetum coccineum]